MDPGGPKPDVAGTPLDGGRRSSDLGDDTSISDQRPSTPQLSIRAIVLSNPHFTACSKKFGLLTLTSFAASPFLPACLSSFSSWQG